MIRFSIADRLLVSHLLIFLKAQVPVPQPVRHRADGRLQRVQHGLIVDTILVATVVGIPLIPIVTFYMFFWNTDCEYGLPA